MSEPRVHAGYMKDVAASLTKLGPEGERVRAADPALFRGIEEASRGAWLPISANLRWVEAAATAFGWPAGLDFLSARLRDQFDNPLFRAFIQGGINLFGLDPAHLIRLIPRGLAITFRDCGEWTVERASEDSVALRAVQLPKEVAAHARWIESIGAGALAVLWLCNKQGTARLADHRASEGGAVVVVRWSAASAG